MDARILLINSTHCFASLHLNCFFQILDNYKNQDDFVAVKAFNERPDAFDVDDFISRMNDRWNQDPTTVSP
jgi:hypothetical protein